MVRCRHPFGWRRLPLSHFLSLHTIHNLSLSPYLLYFLNSSQALMSDRVFPSSKPAATNGTTAPPAKPTLRPPYRPQPHHRRHRTDRNYCCCCFFWTGLIVLILVLIFAIAATALYVLYRPHRPAFSIPSLRIHRLKLTTSADSSSNHLSALFNFTVTSKNPNSHLTYFYQPFDISIFSSNDVLLGNGTIPAFTSPTKNQTVFKNVIASGSNELDTDSVTSLKSDLKKKTGVPLKIVLDTKVKVKAGKLKSKKIGIRVTCEEFKGVVIPKGKSPSVATTDKSKCKVDLRIKIWKWTF